MPTEPSDEKQGGTVVLDEVEKLKRDLEIANTIITLQNEEIVSLRQSKNGMI